MSLTALAIKCFISLALEDGTAASKKAVEGLGDELGTLLKEHAISLSGRSLLGTVKEPWQATVLAFCAAYAPNTARTLGNVELGNQLERSLTAILTKPTPRVYSMVPRPDLLLTDKARGGAALGALLSLVISGHELTSSSGSLDDLNTVGAEVARQLSDSLAPEDRVVIRSLMKIASAVQHGTAETKRSMRDIVRKIDDLKIDIATDRDKELVVSGARVFLSNKVWRPPQVPESWLSAADRVARALREMRSDRCPSLYQSYVDPIVSAFVGSRVVTTDDAQPAYFSDQVRSWLASQRGAPLALVGDPGSGKTSACKMLVSETLEDWSTAIERTELAFPLYVPLRDIRTEVQSLSRMGYADRARFLLQTCIGQATRLLDVSSGAGPPKQKLLLILDGFDELNLVDRPEIVGFLTTLTVLATTAEFMVSILITGRTAAFEPFWTDVDRYATNTNGTWQRLQLMPLALGLEGTARGFLERWLAGAAMCQISVPTADELRSLVAGENGISGLAETPVLLSLICELSLSMEDGGVFAARTSERYQALEWLVMTSITARGNARETERKRITDEEFETRLSQYCLWAWRAVLGGGVTFDIGRIETRADSVQGEALVEFFIKPDEHQPGKAAFLHRTIAEFLAGLYLVNRLHRALAQSDSEAIAFLKDLATSVAIDALAIDSNLKSMVLQASVRKSATDMSRARVAVRRWIGELYSGQIGGQPLRSPIFTFLGAAAEVTLLFLAGVDGTDAVADIIRVAEIRTYSPRRGSPLGIALDGILFRRLALDGLGLSATSFQGSIWEDVSAKTTMLTASSFKNATIRRCDFTAADLSGVDFRGALISACIFTDAVLNQADFVGAEFRNCEISEAQRAVSRGASASNRQDAASNSQKIPRQPDEQFHELRIACIRRLDAWTAGRYADEELARDRVRRIAAEMKKTVGGRDKAGTLLKDQDRRVLLYAATEFRDVFKEVAMQTFQRLADGTDRISQLAREEIEGQEHIYQDPRPT